MVPSMWGSVCLTITIHERVECSEAVMQLANLVTRFSRLIGKKTHTHHSNQEAVVRLCKASVVTAWRSTVFSLASLLPLLSSIPTNASPFTGTDLHLHHQGCVSSNQSRITVGRAVRHRSSLVFLINGLRPFGLGYVIKERIGFNRHKNSSGFVVLFGQQTKSCHPE